MEIDNKTRQMVQSLDFKQGISLELPGLVEHYKFYLDPESPWGFKVMKEIFTVLNQNGFDKLFLERVEEPKSLSDSKIAEEVKRQNSIWTVTHTPDASFTGLMGEDYKYFSFLDDLYRDLRDEFRGKNRVKTYLQIAKEMGDDDGNEILDPDRYREPRVNREEEFMRRLKVKIGQALEREKAELDEKSPNLWSNMIKYHKNLRLLV